jgi:MarR family
MQISDATREEAFRLFGKLVARSDPGRLEAFADLGLTMTQLRLLFLLRGADGLSAGALADQLGVTPSTLTRIMDRLGLSAITSPPKRAGRSRRWSALGERAWTASSPGSARWRSNG